jgi:hypothetical protein
MQFTTKTTATATNQRKSRKQLIVATAAAGLLVPAFAVGSPALAATLSSAHRPGTVQLDSSGRHLPGLPAHGGRPGQDQWGSGAGHLGKTPPRSGSGKGGSGKGGSGQTPPPGTGSTPPPTTGSTPPPTTGSTPPPGTGSTPPPTTGTTPTPTPTPTSTCPPYRYGPECLGHKGNQFF